MDAFHSEKGRKMYQRLPKSKIETSTLLETMAPIDSKTQIAFRALRTQLEQDGWWKRNMNQEYKLLSIWGSLVTIAAVTARTKFHLLSTFLLGLSMTTAGWLGHDYIHGVDEYCMSPKIRNFAAYAAGLLPVWWSDKHNKHHALSKYNNI